MRNLPKVTGDDTRMDDDKEILLVIADVNMAAKEFQKHECCSQNDTRVPTKPDYATSNTSMKDFTPNLNSTIDIIEQAVILGCRHVPVFYLLQAYGYESEIQELPEVFEIQIN